MADRTLDEQLVEGEIGIIIDYTPGSTKALDLLNGAMALISAIDELDRALLGSINTELEPVSIVNDVQHSSLKLLLARLIKSIPDHDIASLEWKSSIGRLLVKGKHALLQKLDADGPTIERKLEVLAPDYAAVPGVLIGYRPPSVREVQSALQRVQQARDEIHEPRVVIQTEYGDVDIAPRADSSPQSFDAEPVRSITNRGREQLKVRYPDMIGKAQWRVQRAGRTTGVEILHREWLERYQARQVVLLPGDSLDCTFEETVTYDVSGDEIERKISITEVHGIVSPPRQLALQSPL